MNDLDEALASLHTTIVDVCEGYEEGARLADEPAIAALFARLLDMHRGHAAALAAALVDRGVEPDEDGSYLQYVHKAVLGARSILGGLDESVVPGLRDGEQRILEDYDGALGRLGAHPELGALVERQRDAVAVGVQRLQAREHKGDA